ncbi:hypothetical protein VA613_09065 [Thiobacillus sedimenti]|uniref:Uncharacterized protein n=1 Tax=Thiobacillus sedimenti TaxID=3110231 RepID=A0ABZ1CJQ2_9PROT|nr:hypothetical protein [Thiobacillus sp. SCUT-2]WRS38163.1 hypothetical protein VA613_09065 [Thiobacillus sp. SCUT-2]
MVASLSHPPSAGEVAFPSAPGAIMFLHRIDMQDDFRNLSPIRAISFSVEQAEIGDCMSLIVAGEDGGGWGDILHLWLEG